MPEERTFPGSLQNVPEATWTRLSNNTIFFGHQSVGFNIIDGIEDLMSTNSQIRLNIVETDAPADFTTSVFAHARVGSNRDPQSKMDAFATALERGIGDKADVAFFKLCYVDIVAETDVQGVFAVYKNTMSLLKKKHPRITFVHVTVPLTYTKETVKTWIKKITGRTQSLEYDNNVARNQFNDLLRKEYGRKEPIFDLAMIESTSPDGTRHTFSKDGNTYYSLISAYSNDGGHLNQFGRRMVAQHLLLFLASLS
ncbi:MAG: hypothetical protein SWE60_00700 [Thermodesulfobacteriota bacterium]|nr:hypothetical protein [Thermodesulfobacteriota bacterium]